MSCPDGRDASKWAPRHMETHVAVITYSLVMLFYG
jgi:hypothetical protein